MSGGIRLLCALSVLCGLALSLAPEGGVKRMMSLCSAVLLMLSMLSLIRDFDIGAYSLEMARYRELGREISAEGEDSRARLQRAVIENECEQYILHRAESMEIRALEASVTARWDSTGCWLPISVELSGNVSEADRETLAEWIETDLGIGKDKQSWREHGS